MAMNKTLRQFQAARKAGTPILAIQTPDPAHTIRQIRANFNGAAPPLVQWDTVCGFRSANDAGKKIVGSGMDQMVNPIQALMAMAEFPDGVVTFMHQMHRFIKDTGVSQAVWNLRDSYKVSSRMVVLMAPSLELPVEIQQDVMVLDEPLPTDEEIREIVQSVYKSGQEAYPDLVIPEDLSDPVSALSGLAPFPAEQSCAVSLNRKGLQKDWLWERKNRAIEQTRGLSIYRGKETFDDIGGCENAKRYFRAVINGNNPPLGYVFIDEIEKQAAQSSVDTVAAEFHGMFLQFMQDRHSRGSLLLGPPGAAKSAISKAIGNTACKPTICLDLGAMKGSLVGESGASLRQAFKVIDSVTQGSAFFLGTCNSIDSLSPELRRRFKSGTFFFDLPDSEERAIIWTIYQKKFGLSGELPYDDGWTGAEIEACCETAYNLNLTMEEAAGYIVPVAKSDAERINRLRKMADGHFISASKPGVFSLQQSASAGRRMEL